MCRTAAQVFLVLLVMVVSVEECGGAGLATSTDLYGLTQKELVMSVIVNQMAILQDRNESSCVCASRGSELREIRLLKEETKKQLQAMEETAQGHLEVMKEEVKNQLLIMKEEVKGELGTVKDEVKGELETMKEEAKGELETMKEEVKRELETMKEEVKGELETMKEVKGELEAMKEEVESQLTAVKEMLETIQNTSIITPSQQPDSPALDTLHNDTDPSLCGANKVLYGSRGSLSPSDPFMYSDNLACEWHVILPEGTRPVFRWEYIQIEALNIIDGIGPGAACFFDYVSVAAPGISDTQRICGNEAPSQHPMYSITDNEFTVTFKSDDTGNYKGFLLHYQAEIY